MQGRKIFTKFKLNRPFVKLVFLVAGVLLIIGLAGSSYRLWKKRDIVAERQAVLAELELENQRLKNQLEETKTEGFIERMAREKLGLVKEGETVVIVDKGQETGDKGQETPQTVPNWKKWWGLFF